MKQRWQKLIINYALVLALYLGAALLITWPAVQTASTRFIGSETGDTYEMARNVWWFTYAIHEGIDPFYQSLLGYPEGFSSAVLMTLSLQYYPMSAAALILPLPLAYNLVIWIYMALNGWAMYWLLRDLLDDDAAIPAFLAGLIFMAFPLFQGHLSEGHAGLMAFWPAPLFVWAVLRLIEAKSGVWRWLLLSAIFFFLTTGGHILQAIYVLLPIMGWLWLTKFIQRDWVALRRLIGMGIVAVVLMLPILWPALGESFGERAYVDTTGFVRYSADLLAIISPSFFHPVWGDALDYPRRVLGANLGEGFAYIGIVAFGLSAIATLKVPTSRWWLFLAGFVWVLSLGPALKLFDQPLLINGHTIPLPFALLQDIPGFNLARTPARFNFAFAIALAVLVGYGAQWVWQRRATNRIWHIGVVLSLSGFILWEYQSFWPMLTLPSEVPQAVHDLRQRDEIEAVFNIPYGHALAAKEGLYLQTAHQKPLIAGQVTRTTPVDPAKLALLQGTLSPDLLNDAGADIIILHKGRAAEIGQLDMLQSRAQTQLGNPFYENDRLALFAVPDGDITTASMLPIRANIAQTLTGGITLASYSLFTENGDGVALHWRFDNALQHNDIRFVHVVDDAGELIWQQDNPIPQATTQGFHAEYVPIDAHLPAGAYTVRVGWYRLDGDVLTPYLNENSAGYINIGALLVE